MQTHILKPGTKIEIRGCDLSWNVVWHPAVIKPWRKISGPRMDGWHTVRFADGEVNQLCHETCFRVVSA